MRTLVLVRHGVTAWNEERRVQGRTDVPLSPRGRSQIQFLLAPLATCGLQLVVTSPVLRAVESAEIIASQLSVPVLHEHRLTERDVGDWTGKTVAELEHAEESWREYQERPFESHPRGGEPWSAFADRIADWCLALDRFKERRIAVVSHADVIRVLLCHHLGLPTEKLRSFTVGPGSLTILATTSHGSRLQLLNYSSEPVASVRDDK